MVESVGDVQQTEATDNFSGLIGKKSKETDRARTSTEAREFNNERKVEQRVEYPRVDKNHRKKNDSSVGLYVRARFFAIFFSRSFILRVKHCRLAICFRLYHRYLRIQRLEQQQQNEGDQSITVTCDWIFLERLHLSRNLFQHRSGKSPECFRTLFRDRSSK